MVVVKPLYGVIIRKHVIKRSEVIARTPMIRSRADGHTRDLVKADSDFFRPNLRSR
jgi:hypothetical protein